MIVCGYCGRQYQLAPAPALAPPPMTPSFPAPAAPSGTHAVLIVAALVFVLLVVGAAGVSFFFVRAAASGASVTPGAAPRPASGAKSSVAPGAPRGWYSRGEPTVMPGAGKLPNLIGMVGLADGGLAALDVTSGKVVWHVQAPSDTRLYSDGRDVLLGYDAAKRVIRYDTQTGRTLWTINLADFVRDITFGDGCANLEYVSSIGIDTATGTPKKCVSSTAPVEARGVRDVKQKRGDVELLGTIVLDNKPINADPPRFGVSASRGGRELWRAVPTTLEPIWTSDGFHRSVAFTPAGAFIYGRNPSDHLARWLLVDTSTGATTYTSKSDVKVDQDVWMTSTGNWVFVVHDLHLEAYLASTGKLAWELVPP